MTYRYQIDIVENGFVLREIRYEGSQVTHSGCGRSRDFVANSGEDIAKVLQELLEKNKNKEEI